jgi:hypothetical protein
MNRNLKESRLLSSNCDLVHDSHTQSLMSNSICCKGYFELQSRSDGPFSWGNCTVYWLFVFILAVLI